MFKRLKNLFRIHRNWRLSVREIETANELFSRTTSRGLLIAMGVTAALLLIGLFRLVIEKRFLSLRRSLLLPAVAACGVTACGLGYSAFTGVSASVFANGSAGNVVEACVAEKVDCLICGEVRYHAALDAAQAGLDIIEVGHDASELPLTAILARRN